MLFNISNNDFKEIKEKPFKSEKELQTLCEKNLKELLNLEYVKTEFSVASFRVDTVAFDREANSFVIIEYKNQKNISVIDQGYTYLSTMFNHKADFALRYNITFNESRDVCDFEWSQSRIIFISPNFTSYQVNSINFKDIPIELWKIKRYNNDSISFEQIVSSNSRESIKTIAPTLDTDVEQKVSNETKTYSEEELLYIADDDIVEIYNELKEYILNIDDSIALKPTKLYVGFNRGRKSIVSIKLQKRSLLLWMNANPDMFNDAKNIIKDVTNTGHHGNGNSQIQIYNSENIGYIEDLLKAYILNIL